VVLLALSPATRTARAAETVTVAATVKGMDLAAEGTRATLTTAVLVADLEVAGVEVERLNASGLRLHRLLLSLALSRPSGLATSQAHGLEKRDVALPLQL